MKVGVAASTLSGNVNAQGSSASLARADHTHMVQGVETRASNPSSGHFVGRLYYNTTTNRLMVCLDAATPYYAPVQAITSGAGSGAIVYVLAGAQAVTDTPAAGEDLFWDGTTLSWRAVPAARAYRDVAQSILTGTPTPIGLNQERFDSDVIHDNATNNSRLTAKTAGKYSISGGVRFASNGTGYRQLEIQLNGAGLGTGTALRSVTVPAISGAATNLSVGTVYDLAVNDHVELVARQTSGISLDVDAVGNYSPEFEMVRVG